MNLFFSKVCWIFEWTCPTLWSKYFETLSKLCKFLFLVDTFFFIMSCRLHGYPWPSLATSPYRSSSLAGLQGYIPYPHIAAGLPAFVRPYVGSVRVHHSSLLLQQCPACLVRLTWIVFAMGGGWPYSWCLVGCCRQDLFNIALNILV